MDIVKSIARYLLKKFEHCWSERLESECYENKDGTMKEHGCFKLKFLSFCVANT